MNEFQPKRIDLSQINKGQKYGYGGIQPEAINAPIEASAYAQEVADIANATSQKALDEIRTAQGTGEGITGLTAYPIGSIYMSINPTDPSILFGGSWQRIQDKFLLSAGSSYTAGTTGGSATVTLTTSQIPSHNHGAYSYNYVGEGFGDWAFSTQGNRAIQHGVYDTTNTGGGQAHNNMPPYLVVYMWQRIG